MALTTRRLSAAIRDWGTALRSRPELRSPRERPVLRPSADPADVESVTVRYLMYVLVPAWFVPGVADYIMHRRTRIERTSGLRESAIHALMMAEMGVPVALVLLFEVNAMLLATAALAAAGHEATAIWDVRSAVAGQREVRPAEQHIHSFLESFPFMAVSALACLHWDQIAGIGRRGAAGAPRPGSTDARQAWRLRPRRRRLPARYLGAVAAGVACLIAMPYGEELVRCYLARSAGPATRRSH